MPLLTVATPLPVLAGIARESWLILEDLAPFVLFGFALAGLLQAWLPQRRIAAALGGNGWKPVLRAALIGIPLPLCSCSVIPVAAGLRQRGAGRGATTAFLIATPESGVDSVAITWSLMDPVMTLMRPLAALFTATVGGLLVGRLPEPVGQLRTGAPSLAPAPLASAAPSG